MHIALDIETMPNPEMISRLPEPEVKIGNIKDQDKIAAKIEEAKSKQIEKMGLNPLTGRIICASMVSEGNNTLTKIIDAINDYSERRLVQWIMDCIGREGAKLITWNGIGFDLPYIYKRAIVLGVSPRDFNAPPLFAWTNRYNTEWHIDLMLAFSGLSGYEKLDTVAGLVLGEVKHDIDFSEFPELMQSESGRAKIAAYCEQDTALTYRLFERTQGVLFI